MTTLGANSGRPALRLVQAVEDYAVESQWFCSHCAAPGPGGGTPAPPVRVCSACGFGVLLETRADAAPEPDDAFLIIDATLRVQAISRSAESLLAVNETAAIRQMFTALLVPADAETHESSFAGAVHGALHADEVVTCFVRPWNTYGVRMRARIAPCGPPRAALLVLEGSRPKLRAVRTPFSAARS